MIKLSANENPYGPSAKAIAAAAQVLHSSHVYPDAQALSLRRVIAELENVSVNEVIIGNGSSEIIDLIFRTLGAQGDQLVVSEGAFIAYSMSATNHGVEILSSRLTTEFQFDLERMLTQIKDNPRVKFVALPNPNNPTGAYLSHMKLSQFLSEIEAIRGGSVLVILDSAYADYVAVADFPNPIEAFRRFSNVLVLKTFSKIHGLAGLRIGYAIASGKMIQQLQNMRMPFIVSTVGLASAEASLLDKDYICRSHLTNLANRNWLAKAFFQIKVPTIPSQTNFLLLNTKMGLGKSGLEIYEDCLKEGIQLTPVANYGLPDFIRVSVGTEDQNRMLRNTLSQMKQKTLKRSYVNRIREKHLS